VADEVVPHFHNEPGVPVIQIGAKEFMCIGALPPQDHPHVFCDMGNDLKTTWNMCAIIARRSIATTLHSRLTKRARRNASCNHLH
jgi:uncharacterized Zn-finger protein